MKKIYFFESKRVTTSHGESRIELYPLPGQTTFSSETGHAGESVPVDTDMRVQAGNADRSFYCGLPLGTRFACVEQGSTLNRVRLAVLMRNGTGTYRADNIVALTNNESVTDGRRLPDEDVRLEYERWASVNEPEEQAPAATENDNTAETEEQSSAVGEHTPVTEEETPAVTDTDVINGMISVTPLSHLHLISSKVEMDRVREHLRGRYSNSARVIFDISRLIDLMRTSVVKFKYVKANGDERIAYGTRNADIIGRFNGTGFGPGESRDQQTEPDGAHVRYYDAQRRAWRSFCTADFRELMVSGAEGHLAGSPLVDEAYMRTLSSVPVIG